MDEIQLDPSAIDEKYKPIASFDEWHKSANLRMKLIESARSEFEKALDLVDQATADRTLHDAMSAAALETGSIEGLYPEATGVTLSLISGKISAERAMAETTQGTANIQALVTSQRDAYNLAFDAATGQATLTGVLLREIHATVTAAQETYLVIDSLGRTEDRALVHGEYKTHSNHVLQADGTVHAYCPVQDVRPEMGRLVDEVISQSFVDGHPILQSAYIHHAITHIHPFADGNGRTARVLASIPLVRAYSVPLVVLADRKPDYWAAQANADNRNFQPFVSFLEESIVDLFSLLAVRLQAAGAAAPNSLRPEIEEAIADRIISVRERTDAARRLEALLEDVVSNRVAEIAFGSGVSGQVVWGSGGQAGPTGYVGMGRLLFAQAKVDEIPDFRPPHVTFKIGVSSDAMEDRPFSITSSQQTPLLIRTSEIDPRPKQALRLKLTTWVDVELRQLPEMLLRRLKG